MNEAITGDKNFKQMKFSSAKQNMKDKTKLLRRANFNSKSIKYSILEDPREEMHDFNQNADVEEKKSAQENSEMKKSINQEDANKLLEKVSHRY